MELSGFADVSSAGGKLDVHLVVHSAGTVLADGALCTDPLSPDLASSVAISHHRHRGWRRPGLCEGPHHASCAHPEGRPSRLGRTGGYSPTISPSAFTSMLAAREILGRPGISII